MLGKSNIVLFDGICVLCNASVNFLYNKINLADYEFVGSNTLQGEKLIEKFNLKDLTLYTVVLIKDNRIYTHSDALIKILNDLPGKWKLLKIFKIIPKIIRDKIYSYIVNNRYKIFGKIE